jgi:predicted RNA binding protein YcfA (HicA-like mRNA interferase family)
MGKKKKRLAKARNNPKNVSFEELRQILADHGFTLNRVGGSHYTFTSATSKYTVPYGRVVKETYVKDVLELIANITIEEEQEDE